MNKKLKDITFYEIYPNSFSDSNGDGYGDFKGITSKLDYIKSLGVGGIWLNPHYDSPFMDGGYDVRDFYKVSSRFGTEEDFDEMVKGIHDRGMILIVDLVAGHSSEECEWFKESCKPEHNKYSDLYVWTDNPWVMPEGMHFQNGRHQRNGCFAINFFVTQPAFNYGFNKVEFPSWQMSYKDPRTFQARDLMVDICKYWLSRGVDGFRVDMANSLVKNDPWETKKATIEVWHYIFKCVKAEYPNSVFVAEWGIPEQSFKAGFDMDFMLNWDALIKKLARVNWETKGKQNSFFASNSKLEVQEEFEKTCERIKKYAKKGYFSFISGNHDEIRCSDGYTEDETKLFMLFVMTMPGVPYLYYGDEIYMKYQSLPSKECGYHRTGVRTPMSWDNSKGRGFSSADEKDLFLPSDYTTSVEDEEKKENSLLHVTRDLINLRNKNKSLRGNNIDALNLGKRVLAYKRNDLTVIINPSKKNVSYEAKKIIYSVGDVILSKGKVIVDKGSAAIVK